MRTLAFLLLVIPLSSFAQNDDGFIWIDANTRIKIKPASAGSGATSAPQKAPEQPPKKDKKEQPAKK